MTLWKLIRNINLALPEELLAEIDEAAKHELLSRTAYIRRVLQAAIEKRDPNTRYKLRGEEPWLYDPDDS